MYNYVYGVTNVPYLDFAGGIFLGSLKPYLLDSYLGYFGKTVVDGTAASATEDVVLLVALGASVLIGVFASQLAGETWESVQEEVEAEKRAKKAAEGQSEDDNVVWSIMDMELPKWVVGFQYALQDATERMNTMIDVEYKAAVWNYTTAEEIPRNVNPACCEDAPELVLANSGFDFGASTCDGLVLSPVLFGAFLKYANPLYDPTKEEEEEDRMWKDLIDDDMDNMLAAVNDRIASGDLEITCLSSSSTTTTTTTTDSNSIPSGYMTDVELIDTLKSLRIRAKERIEELKDQIDSK
mmetsp:Transcript_5282/g.7734  ORF Transcript_5282/g.7734 Transcript_5282/m.7734 type:complete len:296 (-) Transcript_5282:45-932(-)